MAICGTRNSLGIRNPKASAAQPPRSRALSRAGAHCAARATDSCRQNQRRLLEPCLQSIGSGSRVCGPLALFVENLSHHVKTIKRCKEPRLAPVYQRKENDRLGTIRPAPSPDRRASVAMAHKRPSTIDKNKIISTSDCLSGSCRRWFHAQRHTARQKRLDYRTTRCNCRGTGFRKYHTLQDVA